MLQAQEGSEWTQPALSCIMSEALWLALAGVQPIRLCSADLLETETAQPASLREATKGLGMLKTSIYNKTVCGGLESFGVKSKPGRTFSSKGSETSCQGLQS